MVLRKKQSDDLSDIADFARKDVERQNRAIKRDGSKDLDKIFRATKRIEDGKKKGFFF